MERYAEFKDSDIDWIGEIPKKWETSRLKYSFAIKKRIAGEIGPEVLSVTQNGIRVKNITSGEGQLAQDYSKYQWVYPGDYIMNHMDLLTGWVDCSDYIGVTSPDYRVFTPISAEVERSYYLYVFQHCYSGRIFYGLGQGVSGLGRWRLQADTFKNFSLPIPPISEQRAIANYLDSKTTEIDGLVIDQQKSIELLREYRKAVISEAVTKGLDPTVPMKDSDIDWVGEIPEEWDEKKLRFLGRISTGNHDTVDATEDGKFPFYVRSPKVERINESSFSGEAVLMAGDGAGAGRIFHYATGEYGVHQRVYCIRSLRGITAKFLWFFMQEFFHYEIDRCNAKSTVDSVRLPMLLDFLIPVPSLGEQKAVTDYLEAKTIEIDFLITDKQQLVNKLKEYRKSLISEAVTGKFKVPGVD
ncbi:MAG: restriction endonuclease subunit S [Gordonibacter sp.]|nr:restriction endonuclease subunit S [Gordonibacter sp.]